MSFKYNHFLLSTCLPVIAFTTFTIPLANAGFEWNPPKVEEVKPETAAIPSITPKPLEAIDNVSVGTPANIKRHHKISKLQKNKKQLPLKLSFSL